MNIDAFQAKSMADSIKTVENDKAYQEACPIIYERIKERAQGGHYTLVNPFHGTKAYSNDAVRKLVIHALENRNFKYIPARPGDPPSLEYISWE
jgi:hypothetical protein